jgi:fatty-acyl-CoA synthase
VISTTFVWKGIMPVFPQSISSGGSSSASEDPIYIELLLARLSGSPNVTVLKYRGQVVTTTGLLIAIYRYARVLAELGIKQGQLIALWAPNSPDALAVRYAANLLGAATMYLPAPASVDHRSELLAQIQPTLLVVFAETARWLPNGPKPQLASIGCDLAGTTSLRLDTRAAAQSGEPVYSLARPDQLAVVVSSGGTTGVPKGSLRDFAAYTAMVHVPTPAGCRRLVNGPLANVSQVLVDMTLLGGGTVVLQDSFDAAQTLAMIESERITDLQLVEPQRFEVMDHPDVAQRDLTSLRAITHIGTSAPPTLRRRAVERLGAIIAHTYGGSEMGMVSALSPADYVSACPEPFTDAGRVLHGVEVRIRLENGMLAELGQYGSIEVRSPAMAMGYRNRPESQAVAFQDGWYRTGDFGCLRNDGRLQVMGRESEVTCRSNILTSPTLIEDALCQLPAVRYAVVVVDKTLGGALIAAVVPWPGFSIDPEQCRNVIAKKSGSAIDRQIFVLSLGRVPLTKQGKPDRATLRLLADRSV